MDGKIQIRIHYVRMLDFQICNEKIVNSKLPECVLPKAQVALFSCVTGRMGGGGGGVGGGSFIFFATSKFS